MSQHNFKPEDFISKIKELEIKNNKRTIWTITIIAILFFGYILFTAVFVNKTDNEAKGLKKQNEVLLIHLTKEDSSKKAIMDFFSYQNNGDTLGISSLLADTLSRYYLINKPIAKSKLLTSSFFEVLFDGKYIVDTTFTISNNNDTLSALVKTKAVSKKDTINLLHEVKLNSKFKFIYVRAYKLSSTTKTDLK